MQREIYALLPRLASKVGHIFHYHLAVQEVARLLQWQYFAFAPVKVDISLPENWRPVLANDLSEHPKGLLQKGLIFFQNLLAFRKIFRSIEKNERAIVFLEHFEFVHLASFLFALLFLKPRFHFWILFRYAVENRQVKALLYRFFLWSVQRKLGTSNVICLTDSELLSNVLSKDLQFPFSVVPIPHTEKKETERKGTNSPLLFWWPGGLIREDKGLFQIQKISELLRDRTDIFLVVAEKAREALSSPQQALFIPTSLSRDEYVKWMQKATLVLLPYSLNYRYQTSGIFVEAISLGAIPIVTKNTWMAYELNRFGLSELCFDWNEKNLISSLVDIPSNINVEEKLRTMRLHYHKTHTPEGFAAVFQELAKDNYED